MFWTDLLWVCYPLRETYQGLKYPRLKIVRHWLIFWYIFMLLELVELVTFGFLPFWAAIKGFILFINWKQSMTEISYKIVNVYLKQGILELKKIESVKNLLDYSVNKIPSAITHLDQNPYIQWIIWYIRNNNDQQETQTTKKIF